MNGFIRTAGGMFRVHEERRPRFQNGWSSLLHRSQSFFEIRSKEFEGAENLDFRASHAGPDLPPPLHFVMGILVHRFSVPTHLP